MNLVNKKPVYDFVLLPFYLKVAVNTATAAFSPRMLSAKSSLFSSKSRIRLRTSHGIWWCDLCQKRIWPTPRSVNQWEQVNT